jgi:hypothetical protein
MKMLKTCVAMCLALLAVVFFFRTTVNARFVHFWDFADIAKEAEVLVVGEVLSVAKTGKIDTDKTDWKIPLLKMTATIRVIRTFPDPCQEAPVGQQVEIEYFNEDYENEEMPVAMGPDFPHPSLGEISIFPLRKNKDKRWELLSDVPNLLIPAAPVMAGAANKEIDVKTLKRLIEQLGVDDYAKREDAQKQILANGKSVLKTLKEEATRATDAEIKNRLTKIIDELGGDSALEFLRAEYANALAASDAHTRYRIADWQGLQIDDIKSVKNYLSMSLGNDADRWMQILAALFAHTRNYAKKFTLVEWLETEDKLHDWDDGRRILAVFCWSRISKKNLDEQIITQACSPGVPHRFSSYLLKANNLEGHPLVFKLLLAALQVQRPEAVSLAYVLLSPNLEKTDPLKTAAVSAACKLISSDQKLENELWDNDLRCVCLVIWAWGQDQDCHLLFDVFKTAQKNNREKYLNIWNSINRAESSRLIPFCAVVLNDQARITNWKEFDKRNCDRSVSELQSITGQDFGIQGALSIEERNAAVEKAKAWLAENPNWTAKTVLVQHEEIIHFAEEELAKLAEIEKDLKSHKGVSDSLKDKYKELTDDLISLKTKTDVTEKDLANFRGRVRLFQTLRVLLAKDRDASEPGPRTDLKTFLHHPDDIERLPKDQAKPSEAKTTNPDPF